jgi:hypothetical protein
MTARVTPGGCHLYEMLSGNIAHVYFALIHNMPFSILAGLGAGQPFLDTFVAGV